jgi:hypothetical protein
MVLTIRPLGSNEKGQYYLYFVFLVVLQLLASILWFTPLCCHSFVSKQVTAPTSSLIMSESTGLSTESVWKPKSGSHFYDLQANDIECQWFKSQSAEDSFLL